MAADIFNIKKIHTNIQRETNRANTLEMQGRRKGKGRKREWIDLDKWTTPMNSGVGVFYNKYRIL
jgi:hypothetical protein